MEVENVIAQHPAVSQCAVIGIPSERWGETRPRLRDSEPGLERQCRRENGSASLAQQVKAG
jgi:acyl-CoA synthetase (AMP-forming)/AMP-acid ligase II